MGLRKPSGSPIYHQSLKPPSITSTAPVTQHDSSTAREYGMPAVLGVRNARQLIQDGEWITIDGTWGIIEF